MPITDFQREVLLLLRAHRNPDSYVAGGVAIHRDAGSARRSNDIDFFHDTEEAVRESSSSDLKLLKKRGYGVKILLNQPGIVRAVVESGKNSLKLEWVRDTAFRFFPVVEDLDLGYRLHDADLAVNKALALANRNEVRDIIDLIQLDKNVLSLAGIVWAACGKDPGFTPEMLLDCISRNSIIRPEQLQAELLEKPVSPPELKAQWLEILKQAGEESRQFPAADIGCLYLEKNGSLIHEPSRKNIENKTRHFGSVGGSWPAAVKSR